MTTKAPTTVQDLFKSLAEVRVHKTSEGTTPDYIYPFEDWEPDDGLDSCHDRLEHFLNHVEGVEWVPFNGNPNNDGPISGNACPGRALAERLTNGIDAVLELKARKDLDPPDSPHEAAARYFDLPPKAMVHEWSDRKIQALAEKVLTFRNWDIGIYEIRDFGVGIRPEDMPNTILSLNRGNKQNKPYLIGKHGQGASNTLQFSELTLIATRHVESDEVGFTIVKASWENADGSKRKTPTYSYLVVNGEIMRLKAADCNGFPHGTCVRHFGYPQSFSKQTGRDSIYGLSNRMLGDTVLPIVTENCRSKVTRSSNKERLPYFPHKHVLKGTFNHMERNFHKTRQGKIGSGIPIREKGEATHEVGAYRFGTRDVVTDMGSVTFRYWVLDETKVDRQKKSSVRTEGDALKNYVDQFHPIIFTLDGQNHAEGERHWITAKTGAGLWNVGKWMIVQVDCDNLHPRAKYELFTSSRDRVKDTALSQNITRELVEWLQSDLKLQRLNETRPKTGSGDKEKRFAERFREFLSGKVDLPKVIEKQQRRKERRVYRGPHELTKLYPKLHPTYVQWSLQNEWTLNGHRAKVCMYPGQKYTWYIETDAPETFWDTSGRRPRSHIEIIENGLVVSVKNAMDGQRIPLQILCPEDSAEEEGEEGNWRSVLVRLYSKDWKLIDTAELGIHRITKKPDKEGGGKTRRNGTRNGDGIELVDVEREVLQPQRITDEDEEWKDLQWGSAESVGFAVKTNGGLSIYYNGLLPSLLEAERAMSKAGLEEAFLERYEMYLVYHAASTLGRGGPIDEESFTGEDAEKLRDQVRADVASTADVLVGAAKTEILLERDCQKALASASAKAA